MNSHDSQVTARAAADWCAWEAAVLSAEPHGPATPYGDRPPAARIAFVRIASHYFAHAAWLEEGALLRDAHRLTGIPGVPSPPLYRAYSARIAPKELEWGGERAPGAADLVGMERGLDVQDQPLDAGARERLPPARVRPEPPLVEPREHRNDEAGRPATRGIARVARDAHQVGEPRMHRLRV